MTDFQFVEQFSRSNSALVAGVSSEASPVVSDDVVVDSVCLAELDVPGLAELDGEDEGLGEDEAVVLADVPIAVAPTAWPEPEDELASAEADGDAELEADGDGLADLEPVLADEDGVGVGVGVTVVPVV